MKKHILNIFIAALVLAMGGCSDDVATPIQLQDLDAIITITTESMGLDVEAGGKKAEAYFSSRGGIAIVRVESSRADWSFETEGNWFDIERIPDGLIINVNDNKLQETLNGKITLKAATDAPKSSAAEIVITQHRSGGDNLLISTDQVILTAGGQYPETVEIITDSEEWDFEVKSTWLIVERDEKTITLTARPNVEISERRVDISVSAIVGGEKVTEKLMVFQEAKAFIKAEPMRIFSYYDDGGGNTFTISTNQRVWDADIVEVDWIDIKANDDFTVDITIHPNTNAENRTYSINLTAGRLDNTAQEEVVISQTGNDRSMMVLEYYVFPDESGKMVDVLMPFHSILVPSMDCTIDWGDGTSGTYTDWKPSHQYPHEGTYYITIKGRMPAISTGAVGRPHADYLKRVKRWGKTGLIDMTAALQYTRGMVGLAPDLDGSFSEVKSFNKAFFCAYYLEEIPAGLFTYATQATDFENIFAGAKSFKKIPAGLFDNCRAMVNINAGFDAYYGMGDITESVLEEIPAGLFKNCTKITNASSLFSGHDKLKTIPADILSYFTEVTQLTGMFSRAGIKIVPEGLLDNCTKVTNVATMFMYSKVESVPANLLAKLPELTQVLNMFAYAENLKAIPAGFFDNNPKLYTFYGTFRGTAIQEIPAGLFDNVMPLTTTSNSFQDAFNGCTKLETLPPELFKNCSNAKSYNGCFSGCTSIHEIPSGNFFNGIPTANITISNIFSGCTSLRRVGGHIFDLLRLNSFAGLFQNCESLEYIDEELFAGKPDVTNFSNVFQNCKSLTTVPAKLFEKNIKATNFSGAFYGCRNLTSVPAELFETNVAVTNFQNVFRECVKLTTVPGNIFEKNIKVTNFSNSFQGSAITAIPVTLFRAQAALNVNLSYAFAECTKLEQLPSGLFSGMKTTNFSYLLQGATSLKTIPDDMFTGCSGANINFSYIFSNCTTLTTVPPIFKGLTTAQNVSYAFRGSGITTLPSDIFEGCSNINNISGLLQNCTKLVAVPGGMFIGTKPFNFNYVFNGCTALQTVPADVFDGVTSSPNVFLQTFADCSSLKSIPAGIFDNFKKANSFSNTFNGCVSLTGESPYTMVGSNKVHLYERENYSTEFTKPNIFVNCFLGSTGLSDYANIPDNWK